MLKPKIEGTCVLQISQPPSGGCVLKRLVGLGYSRPSTQPPSGGCVLKQSDFVVVRIYVKASRLRAAVC